MSNESLALSDTPLPIARISTPANRGMSPQTVQSTLSANDNLPAPILHKICNGLLDTLAMRETNLAILKDNYQQHVDDLQQRVLRYEETFEQAPKGYQKNDGKLPHFKIPIGKGLSWPAKWIKRNDDGTVSGYTDTVGPNEHPYIIDIFAQPDYKYSADAEPFPAMPLPQWFCQLLGRPTAEFATLLRVVEEQNDWGLSREVTRYRDLDKEVTKAII